MDAQQSCRFEWLKGEGAGGFARNAEHAVLICMVTLEKIDCCQQPTRPWAPGCAIVIFSDHVRSIVGLLALSGSRWSKRLWNASTVRCGVACVRAGRGTGPRQRCAAYQRERRGNTRSCLGWAHVARVVSRPKRWIVQKGAVRARFKRASRGRLFVVKEPWLIRARRQRPRQPFRVLVGPVATVIMMVMLALVGEVDQACAQE